MKKYIYIFFYLSVSKIYFFPQPCVNWEFLYPTMHCGIFVPKNRTKVAFGQKDIAIPVQKLLLYKIRWETMPWHFFPSPPSAHFSSFFIEEIATPRRKLTEFAHTLLQEAVTYRPPITIDSTVTNQPPKLREQSRTPAINYHRLSSTIRSLPLFDYRTPRPTLESLHLFENILFEFTFDLRFKDKS